MNTTNKFIKRPIVSQVTFATCDGSLTTLEGVVSYRAGDALMIGPQGECWPITRDRFDASYTAVQPTSFGENGGYVKKYIVVEATQLSKSTQVRLTGVEANIVGQSNDWLITGPDGSQWVVANTIFNKTYMTV